MVDTTISNEVELVKIRNEDNHIVNVSLSHKKKYQGWTRIPILQSILLDPTHKLNMDSTK